MKMKMMMMMKMDEDEDEDEDEDIELERENHSTATEDEDDDNLAEPSDTLSVFPLIKVLKAGTQTTTEPDPAVLDTADSEPVLETEQSEDKWAPLIQYCLNNRAFWATSSEVEVSNGVMILTKTNRSILFKMIFNQQEVIIKRALTPINNSNIKKEIDNYKKFQELNLSHDNLLTMWSHFLDPESQLFAIVLPCFDADLGLYIEVLHSVSRHENVINAFQRMQPMQFDDQTSFHLLKQLISGLNFLHMCGLAHRDLKPENCLLRRRGDVVDQPPIQLVICDHEDLTGINNINTHITPGMRPPMSTVVDYTGELTAGQADVYAAGLCILWCMNKDFYLWDRQAICSIVNKFDYLFRNLPAFALPDHSRKKMFDQLVFECSFYDYSEHAKMRLPALCRQYEFLRKEPVHIEQPLSHVQGKQKLLMIAYFMISESAVARPLIYKVDEWLDEIDMGSEADSSHD